MTEIKLPPKWSDLLEGEFEKQYMIDIKEFLKKEMKAGKIIYPEEKNIFNAFNYTDFDDLKVVILGQDPYHGPGQAHGLCFSVLPGVKTPPSLRNIFKEINLDMGLGIPEHGNLEKWAKQGVLLLNPILTVEAEKAASHSKIGRQKFTDEVIRKISDKKQGVVFLLRGNYAKGKKELIDTDKHHILESVHPSPLSASRGFIGCKHFSKTNEILKKEGKKEIDWNLQYI